MFNSRPRLLRPLLGATSILLFGLALVAVGVYQLGTAGADNLLMLWVTLPIVGMPLALWAGYHLYGLVTAKYHLDRDQFSLAWGGAREVIPLGAILRVERTTWSDLPRPRMPSPPGIRLGQAAGQKERIEFFAADTDQLVLVECEDSAFLISPRDTEAFLEAFLEATRMGALREVPAVSQRPDLLPARLWSDRLARGLLLAGLLVPIGLLGYLGVRMADLPGTVPFGFTALGAPGPDAPPRRLLLLPLIGGLVWLADLLLGGYLYRQSLGRPFAYALWGLAVLVGFLLWGASLQMLAAAL